jgi:hypothetical protein
MDTYKLSIVIVNSQLIVVLPSALCRQIFTLVITLCFRRVCSVSSPISKNALFAKKTQVKVNDKIAGSIHNKFKMCLHVPQCETN